MLTNSNYSLSSDVDNDNIISYDKINDYVACRQLNFMGVNRTDAIKFNRIIMEGIYKLIDKNHLNENRDMIISCFEVSCNILYDRKILQEVIEKQKSYEIEYVVDFLRYVLRIFIKRCESNTVLTKTQCLDIRDLCRMIISVNNSFNEVGHLIEKISAKDIIKCFKNVNI